MTVDTEKMKALALAATPGQWQVITDEHPTYAEAYTHKERRIFTRDANPQLGDIYPVVNSSRGIAEKRGDAAIWMVSIEQVNAYYIAAACPATVLELIAEVERLRAEVKEWVCIDCNTAYPGPPQPGFACVICPKCKGTTMPRQRAEIEKLRAELAGARSASKVAETRMDAGSHGGAGLAAPAAGTVKKDAGQLESAAEALRRAKRELDIIQARQAGSSAHVDAANRYQHAVVKLIDAAIEARKAVRDKA